MKITIDELQAYLADRYCGWATEQSMFMKLVEEMGEVADVLNKRAGRKASQENDLQEQLGIELVDMIHYIVAIAAINDIDLIEANEAFAAQSIAVGRELGFDMSKVNVNGGAISLGHPIGCSGARIIVTLLHEMARRDDSKKGLATLCIGGGMGVATIFEKC